jgi:bacillithiol biosynthesis cysteine-adding enzyme BshC
MQKLNGISFQEVGLGSTVFQDYYAGTLPAELPFSPHVQWKDKIAVRADFPLETRQKLAEIIRRQYGPVLMKDVEPLLTRLQAPNAFTVTTGHQLALATGPLYFLYKIASAIRWAHWLKSEYPDIDVIPIYWMNSEDHDFEEINHCFVSGEKVAWPAETPGFATGSMKPSSAAKALETWAKEQKVEDLPAIKQLIQIYQDAPDLATATRQLVHAWMGHEGVLVIDQQDPALKQLAEPVFLKELLEQASFPPVQEMGEIWTEHGYPLQVQPRPLNLFYHHPTSGRKRIVYDQKQWSVVDTDLVFSDKESLVAAWETHPERFSPNVITRPLYQEMVLPNLAYLGGPAEVHYWLQYPLLFKAFSLPFPAVLMRDSLVLLPAKTYRKWEKLGLSHQDFFKPLHGLVKEFIQQKEGQSSFEEKAAALSAIFEAQAQHAAQVDATLVAMVRAEGKRALDLLAHTEKRMLKAAKEKHAREVGYLHQGIETVFPAGVFQERRVNVLTFSFTPVQFFSDLVHRPWDPGKVEMYVLPD